MSNSIDNLPPEMKARLAQIMAQANAGAPPAETPHQAAISIPAPQPQPQPQPQQKTPSLMDHVIALRQEVAELRKQVDACGQVTEAVGNAVGQMYQMFQVQTQPSNYSANFQAQRPEVEEGDY
tara:strand:- start:10750 stop:11118 length:369 start_codon:yes stop_codon:yes gene_type:complete